MAGRSLPAQTTEYKIHNVPTEQPGNTAGVYCNQLGFTPARDKIATVAAAGTASAESFRIVRAGASVGDGALALEGKLTEAVLDPHSGDTVCRADFSALTQPGHYQVEVAGKLGDPFPVHADAYRQALRSTVRAYYGQRCGCAVDLGHGYKHPACHLHGGYDASSGRAGRLRNAGGWHDAGDYGRYVVNSGITVATLLLAWEMFASALQHLHLDVPESGRHLPDFLAEVKWNLDWMLAMQDHTDGGVWHKQSSRQFCGFVMPQDDPLPSYVIGTGSAPYKSTGATADFAAVMAMAARIYKPWQPEFADRCLVAARRAWVWAMLHPDVRFENPARINTGGYGDHDLDDELLWATAEMFRTTGESYIEQQFLQQISRPLALNAIDAGVPGWGNVGSLGLWAYWLASGSSQHAKDAIAASTLGHADELVRRATASGYGHSLAMREYIWGSNAVVGNQGLLLMVADRIATAQRSPNNAYRATALANMDYLLGRNCLGTSWVTQVGLRTPQNPHHRPSGSDHIAAPWPGLLVGGPNAGGGDQIANALPKQPPMRMWADDARAYSLNEVAINWNAPLVFLLAAANA